MSSSARREASSCTTRPSLLFATDTCPFRACCPYTRSLAHNHGPAVLWLAACLPGACQLIDCLTQIAPGRPLALAHAWARTRSRSSMQSASRASGDHASSASDAANAGPPFPVPASQHATSCLLPAPSLPRALAPVRVLTPVMLSMRAHAHARTHACAHARRDRRTGGHEQHDA